MKYVEKLGSRRPLSIIGRRSLADWVSLNFEGCGNWKKKIAS
jgi:hypothetical protein